MFVVVFVVVIVLYFSNVQDICSAHHRVPLRALSGYLINIMNTNMVIIYFDNFYFCTVHFDNTYVLITNKCTSLLHI